MASDPQSFYEKVKAVVADALALPEAERAAFVERVCGSDAELRAEVESLLAHSGTVAELLDDSPLRDEGLRAAARAGIADETWSPVLDAMGPFTELRRLAVGGMGAVYEAHQENPSRRVALKLLRRDVVTPDLLERFQREAEILGRLQHPCIAQVFESGVLETPEGEQPYFSMEFVDGRQLVEHANAAGLSLAERLELFASVCDGVEHAHERGVIHRDLKPDNILVTDAGQPKVLDFGVARAATPEGAPHTVLTEHGQVMGTLPYMSPEQISGKAREVDERADVYALGVVLFELLSGRRPHELRHASIAEAARILRDEEPTTLGSIDPRWAGDLETIVGKALEKDRARRYGSPIELAADLRRHLNHQPISARPPSRFYRVQKFVRRHRGLTVGGAIAFLALSVAFAVSLRFGLSEARSAERERRASYLSKLTAAESLFERDPKRAQSILASTREELRGFEWGLISALTDPVAATHTGELVVGDLGDTWKPYGLGLSNTSVALSAEGGFLGALTTEDGIALVDMQSGEVQRTLRAEQPLWRPLLSADGRVLVAHHGEAGSVAWDLAASLRLPDLPGDTSGVIRPWAISPDGAALAWSPENLRLQVVELRSGEPLRALPHDAEFQATYGFAAVGLDGELLRFGDDLHRYREPGEPLPRALELGERIDGNSTTAFDPRGRWIALGSHQGYIDVVERDTLELAVTLRGHHDRVKALAFAPDGSRLVSAASDGELLVWDTGSWSSERTLVTPHPVFELAVGSTEGRMATASKGSVSLLTDPREARRRIEAHASYVYTAAFSPDGSVLATGGWDERVRLWDPWTGELLGALDASDPERTQVAGGVSRSLSFSADGQLLSVVVPARQRLFDAVTLRRADDVVRDETIPLGADGVRHPGAKTSLWTQGESAVVGPDGRELFVFRKDAAHIEVYDATPGRDAHEVLRSIPTDDEVTALDVSPEGAVLAVGTAAGELRLLDRVSGEPLTATRAHPGMVHSVDFHPDGTRLATGGGDGSVLLWRVEPLELLLTQPVHDNYVHAVAFSPDGTQLASASGDGTVTVFSSLSTAERFERVRRHQVAREAMRPRVAALLAELGDAQAAADVLRADTSLSEAQRAAALAVLRRLSN